jgi:hypothetical protein
MHLFLLLRKIASKVDSEGFWTLMMHWRHGQQTGHEALFSAYPIPYRRNYFMLLGVSRQVKGKM